MHYGDFTIPEWSAAIDRGDVKTCTHNDYYPAWVMPDGRIHSVSSHSANRFGNYPEAFAARYVRIVPFAPGSREFGVEVGDDPISTEQYRALLTLHTVLSPQRVYVCANSGRFGYKEFVGDQTGQFISFLASLRAAVSV